MLSHPLIWSAVDRLAAAHGLSPSGLARAAGLDPTAFNKSKRVSPAGRERWPSTESIAKILDATGSSLDDFLKLASGMPQREGVRVPIIGLAQAGSSGYFDDGGFPVGAGWEHVSFPNVADENAYALEVTGDSMQPVYRDGDIVVVSPAETVRRGDRVVAKTRAGEVMVKQLVRRTASHIELVSLNPAYPPRTLEISEVAWIARIVWASQ